MKIKGQSLIFQFILFFLVGLALFIGIGNFFRAQSDILRKDASGLSVEVINNYISSAAVASIDSCKECGTVENKLRISDTVFGYFLKVSLASNGLTISTPPPDRNYTSSVNNLNASVNMAVGSAPSIEPINLTYNRNQNKLEIN